MKSIAIDWSGDRKKAREKTWIAVAENPGNLTSLRNGLSRDDIFEYLLKEKQNNSNFVVGLDFAFSLPSWFFTAKKLQSVHELWALVTCEGEEWLKSCQNPFWGRPGRPKPNLKQHFRKTEIEANYEGSIRPKSVFQIGGAGAVGTGSIRGIPILLKLRLEGFSVWPFHEPQLPCVVEIWPRLLTGQVNKGSLVEREKNLKEKFPELGRQWRTVAASSEDAFDAAVSALVMVANQTKLTALQQSSDALIRKEGWIWQP